MEDKRPLSLRHEDLKNNIAGAIRNSGLPFFVVQYLLEKVLTEVRAYADEEAKRSSEVYYKSLEQSEESEVDANG